MIYVLGAMLAVILALGGVTSCQHKTIVKLEAGIAANKIEAARLLKQAEAQGKADAIASQKDYDDALKTLSLANANYRGRLRDPGRTGSCPAASTTPGVPVDARAGGELSDDAGTFLRAEADRADRAAIYAQKCREYALKPTVREQVEKMRKTAP